MIRKRSISLITTFASIYLASCSVFDEKSDAIREDNIRKQLTARSSVDLKDAFSMLVIESNENAALALFAKKHNDTIENLKLTAPKIKIKKTSFALSKKKNIYYEINNKPIVLQKNNDSYQIAQQEVSSEISLKKVTKNGQINNALAFESKDDFIDRASEQGLENPRYPFSGSYPKVRTIGISSNDDNAKIYLHFEESFLFREASDDADHWNRSNGYQCQIFRVKGNIDELTNSNVSTDEIEDLECLDNEHFIEGWFAERNKVFQFDSQGNVYFPAQIPNSNKRLVYKITKNGTYEDKNSLTEVINANICVDNFLVTPLSSVFYTGHSCQSQGGEGGYFRYISPEGSVTEIARDWWNFIYDTQVEDSQNPETKKDTAVFFGPNPLLSTTSSWDTACLFSFDPEGEIPATRIGEVITCGNNIWKWLELRRTVDVTNFGEGYHNYTGSGDSNLFSPTDSWKKEFKRRCEIKDQVFAGGGSQISAIKQTSKGDIYVIGNVRKKIKGKPSCNVEIRGPHCLIDNAPVLFIDSVDLDSKTICHNNDGTWIDAGHCDWGADSFEACLGLNSEWISNQCVDKDDNLIVYKDYDSKMEC